MLLLSDEPPELDIGGGGAMGGMGFDIGGGGGAPEIGSCHKLPFLKVQFFLTCHFKGCCFLLSLKNDLILCS